MTRKRSKTGGLMQDIPNHNKELYLLCQELTKKRHRQTEIKEIALQSRSRVKELGQEIHQLLLDIEKLMHEMSPNDYSPR